MSLQVFACETHTLYTLESTAVPPPTPYLADIKMADMSKFPRDSMELAHESVMAEEQTIKPLTAANNKSLTLTRPVAAVLVVCALLFLGVIALGAVVRYGKRSRGPGGKCRGSNLAARC
jgi:hypothetical protein